MTLQELESLIREYAIEKYSVINSITLPTDQYSTLIEDCASKIFGFHNQNGICSLDIWGIKIYRSEHGEKIIDSQSRNYEI